MPEYIWIALIVAAVAVLVFLLVQRREKKVEAVAGLAPGLYALFETSIGDFICHLFERDAPETVSNFIGLAQGTKEWVEPQSGRPTKKRLYDGLTFHRIIPGFMIQGGDPKGDGTGGPGFEFRDEISPNLRFDRAGRLAMANRGPNTNGSQFFITLRDTPWLNGRHTIFGQVVKGQEVVEKISQVPRDPSDRPLEPVVIRQVSIQRVQ